MAVGIDPVVRFDGGAGAASSDLSAWVSVSPRPLILPRHHSGSSSAGRRIAHTALLRFHLTKLRPKLEREPSRPVHLLTEPGMGYRFQP